MIEEFISLFQTEFYIKIWGYISATWPIWMPLFFVNLFLNTWVTYRRRTWINEQGSVLLEIKLPKIIERSPAAMEVVLNGLFDPTMGSLIDNYIKGRVRDWFSLEIVSLGGEVKFFIRALKKWHKTIEARIYAEYPNAEVFLVDEKDDYALKVNYDPEKINMFAAMTSLNKADAYPIKTYIDYELDKGGKEQEEIIDPIMPVLEYLGSIKPDEQIWFQILIQGHRKEGLADTRIIPKGDWKEGIKDEIRKIIEKESFVKPSKSTDKDRPPPAMMTFLTTTQTKTIESIERNAGKLAFDAMMRVLYIAPKDTFDGGRIGGTLGSLRQFGSENLNGIRPVWLSSKSYPWEDFRDIKRRTSLRKHLNAYKRRSFFNVPYKHLNAKPYILTTEELATLFHLPGSAITTPTLTRVPSKKGVAPSNLPM